MLWQLSLQRECVQHYNLTPVLGGVICLSLQVISRIACGRSNSLRTPSGILTVGLKQCFSPLE